MAYSFARRTELAQAKGYPSYSAYRKATAQERANATKALAQRAGGSYRGKPAAKLPRPSRRGGGAAQPPREGAPRKLPYEQTPPKKGRRHRSRRFRDRDEALRYWMGDLSLPMAGIAYLVEKDGYFQWEILENTP